ncbi:hypothetical protein HDU76_007028 [Blyttiomyces sp. JEL0837]|nr:hypothetical protein HDU76_007028 [Blyttiomyces sp. JEL0837]
MTWTRPSKQFLDKQSERIKDVIFSDGFKSIIPALKQGLEQRDEQQIKKFNKSSTTTTLSKQITIPKSRFTIPLEQLQQQQNQSRPYKYFTEFSKESKESESRYSSSSSQSSLGRHLDSRYGKIELFNDKRKRHEILMGLLKGWSEFQRENNVVSWIAHGPLIGWFWTGKMLPWDMDLDFQIAYQDLISLIPLNQTIYKSQYLLDINTFFTNRKIYSYNQNVIDARFIDMQTGLFIDITSLAYSNVDVEHISDSRLSPYFNNASPETVATPSNWVSCKSPHYYKHESIFPLHLTTLQGIFVYRPNNAFEILASEYSEMSMVRTLVHVKEGNANEKWEFDEGVMEWRMVGRVLKKGGRPDRPDGRGRVELENGRVKRVYGA